MGDFSRSLVTIGQITTESEVQEAARKITEAEQLTINEDISPNVFVILAYCNVTYSIIYLLFATINAYAQSSNTTSTVKNYSCMFLAVGF